MKIKNKINSAIDKFLVNQGYAIISKDVDKPLDIVARSVDDDSIVFFKVRASKESLACFKGLKLDRSKAEESALKFLENYQVTDVKVRFDTIGIKIIDDNRALIKHHINALGPVEM